MTVQKEKHCLIEINNLKNKVPLLKHLLSLNKSEVYINELKHFYTPLEIGSSLGFLIDEELVYVDWDKKTISIEGLTIVPVLKKKDKLNKYSRQVPKYMKSEKQELNKPYLPRNIKK